jgi:biotin synthase-like enzyme
MFEQADGLKKSMTIVIGLGEKKDDFKLLSEFIEKQKLDRITFYALKPVKETFFDNSLGPKTKDYLWWIAQTRIKFPKLEIIAGTTSRRYQEVGFLLKAGANAFTKFPATRIFNSPETKLIETEIKKVGRQFQGTLTQMPNINWNLEIEKIGLTLELEKAVKKTVISYLERMK